MPGFDPSEQIRSGWRSTVDSYTVADVEKHKFTEKERDDESGLDYFGARYFSSLLGRFMSPDDIHNDTHSGNPQSWNRYAYARNNPLRYVDPTGEAIVAYDQEGNLLCQDLECLLDDAGNLVLRDKTYAPDQYTVYDPNPSATASAQFERVELLNRFGLPLSQYADWRGPVEPGLNSMTADLAVAMMGMAGLRYAVTLYQIGSTATIQDVQNMPTPLPSGVRDTGQFGHEIMKWGRGNEEAIARMGTLTR